MNLSELLSTLPAETQDGKARSQAINSVEVEVSPTSIVGYTSTGRVLIVGPAKDVVKAQTSLSESGVKSHTLTTSKRTDDGDDAFEYPVNFYAEQYELSGYLGAFQAISITGERRMNLGVYAGHESGHFDMVMEFSDKPAISAEISPPGYYWIGNDAGRKSQIKNSLSEIPEMVGSFDKPKFFHYDPEICAHSRSGIVACTRCIDACPTDAIVPATDMIEVNSHLCQGGGSCAAACPTGAITYAYPPSNNLEEILKQLLHFYRESGGTKPTLVFYDKANGTLLLERHSKLMKENYLPVEVEEVGSLGLDICLSALAYGASSIKVLITSETPNSMRRELAEQFEILHMLVQSLGQSEPVIELLEEPFSVEQLNSDTEALFQIPSASFAPAGIKRTDIRTAIEHLYDHAPQQPKSAFMPSHSPFGEINVDTKTCTLCMGCVSVCPASALESGGDSPKLSFIEHNCVQCGLCETACPEGSISLSPRYLFNTDERMRSRMLNEDSPFHCIMCGKPFATSAMLNSMKGKLKGHSMFAKNEDAIKRLEMCEDCRVKDMFAAEGGFPRHKL